MSIFDQNSFLTDFNLHGTVSDRGLAIYLHSICLNNQKIIENDKPLEVIFGNFGLSINRRKIKKCLTFVSGMFWLKKYQNSESRGE